MLWALGFGNLTLLYGLGAAALPILIHLLNRRKFREVRWAATRFLLAAVRKNQRRVRLEQWLLLAVRTLLVIAVVTAMAKPFLESVGPVPLLAGQRTHRVLLLDGSLSMGYSPAGSTRFEQAKGLATQLVRDSRRGDAISVVLMGEPPRVVIGSPASNPVEVIKEIDDLVLPHGATDLTGSFEAVERVLEASDIARKELVVLTDLQAGSWRRAGSAQEDGLKRVIDKLNDRKVSSVVIDLGKAGGQNRAITDLILSQPIVTTGTPVRLTASVRGFGPESSSPCRVRLVVDGQVGPEQVIEAGLPAGEEVPILFNHVFNAPGEHVVEVRIDDDLLALDNRRWLSIPVREAVNVLLVDGDARAEPFQAETDYLAQALSPAADSSGSPSIIRTEVVPESQLSRRDLAIYDAVVLCNVAQVTEAEVTALESYLKQGGGLVVFGGDQVLAENYNRLLYAEGRGLLPASIGESVGDATQKQGSGFTFDPQRYEHPIVAAFEGESSEVQAGLTSVRTWQYHSLRLPGPEVADANRTAKVALAIAENGDPLVVEAPRHRGIVVLVGTSADAGWTTWPLHPSFPPVMEQAVLLSASGRGNQRNVRVGQPLDQVFPGFGTESSVAIQDPAGKQQPARLEPAGDVSRLHFESTDLSGSYLVKLGPPLAREELFAVNPDPVESDPAKLDRASLAAAVPDWSFDYLTDWQGLTVDATSVNRRGDLHRPLLYLVLALLLIESVLAWRFGHHAR